MELSAVFSHMRVATTMTQSMLPCSLNTKKGVHQQGQPPLLGQVALPIQRSPGHIDLIGQAQTKRSMNNLILPQNNGTMINFQGWIGRNTGSFPFQAPLAVSPPKKKTKPNTTSEAPLPYHGAREVHEIVRSVIANTKEGDERAMSAAQMVKLLVDDHGMGPKLANRLYSQIRKGGALHAEWNEAFTSGKFKQRKGRQMDASRSAAAQDRSIVAKKSEIPPVVVGLNERKRVCQGLIGGTSQTATNPLASVRPCGTDSISAGTPAEEDQFNGVTVSICDATSRKSECQALRVPAIRYDEPFDTPSQSSATGQLCRPSESKTVFDGRSPTEHLPRPDIPVVEEAYSFGVPPQETSCLQSIFFSVDLYPIQTSSRSLSDSCSSAACSNGSSKPSRRKEFHADYKSLLLDRRRDVEKETTSSNSSSTVDEDIKAFLRDIVSEDEEDCGRSDSDGTDGSYGQTEPFVLQRLTER